MSSPREVTRTESELRDENQRLAMAIRELQDQQVADWVRLIRFGDVVPRAIEQSLSWKITRPLRLVQTAGRVLRRDGVHTFTAIARSRVSRIVKRG